jgi:hypothetical protein
MSSSFRLLEHPPMPADLHISIRSVLVLFPRVSRSCSGTDVVMALPVPAVAESCTLRALRWTKHSAVPQKKAACAAARRCTHNVKENYLLLRHCTVPDGTQKRGAQGCSTVNDGRRSIVAYETLQRLPKGALRNPTVLCHTPWDPGDGTLRYFGILYGTLGMVPCGNLAYSMGPCSRC